MGWMGWKASKHRAALGGHATDLYAAVMFLRHQVLDDDRIFRTIRSGLALYSSPRWLRRAMASPKGEALPAESRYRDDISAPLTDHRTPAPKPDRATSSPC
jgi:hypothetical protein